MAFSLLVGSDQFGEFLDSIFDLYDAHKMKVSEVGEGLENIYDKKDLDEAYRIYNSQDNPYDLDIDDKIAEIYRAIDKSVDTACEERMERDDEINRMEYNFQKSFFRLVESLGDNMKNLAKKQKNCPVLKKRLEEREKEKAELVQKLQEEVLAITYEYGNPPKRGNTNGQGT